MVTLFGILYTDNEKLQHRLNAAMYKKLANSWFVTVINLCMTWIPIIRIQSVHSLFIPIYGNNTKPHKLLPQRTLKKELHIWKESTLSLMSYIIPKLKKKLINIPSYPLKSVYTYLLSRILYYKFFRRYDRKSSYF